MTKPVWKHKPPSILHNAIRLCGKDIIPGKSHIPSIAVTADSLSTWHANKTISRYRAAANHRVGNRLLTNNSVAKPADGRLTGFFAQRATF
jgi:hypothetical protein